MNSSQQQFLNKGKKPQLKIQTQKRIRYLLHYFGKNSNTGSYFQELRNTFFGLNIYKFFDANPDPESFWPWIRDGKFGSGIRNKHPGSSTLAMHVQLCACWWNLYLSLQYMVEIATLNKTYCLFDLANCQHMVLKRLSVSPWCESSLTDQSGSGRNSDA